MNSPTTNLLVGILAASVLGEATGQNATFTSVFPVEDCHFSTFGGHPYFILDPGHQLVLRGVEDGEAKVLTITSLDQTKVIKLPSSGGTRQIITRVVEERETTGGELTEISRNWYARCIETGDVYYFGEAVDNFEDGKIADHEGAWEAGVNGALPGIIMPRTFLLGARYAQEVAPGIALDQAENIGQGLTTKTPAGDFANCVQVREYDGLDPDAEPSVKIYAPGVGLITDDDILKLEEFRLGAIDRLPSACTFVPFSNHPFFPISPGRQLLFEGEEDGEKVALAITVLDEIKAIPLDADGEATVIQTRVVEERESVDGELAEVSRNFFAQCVETGDVYYFGEEVDFYEDGKLTGHEGAWLAGVENAQPGIIMPGSFVVGAQYFQERAPGKAMDFAVNQAVGVTATVPAGTFTACVTVAETNPLEPDEEPELKTYAPGIGLINDAGILKLTSFTIPNGSPGAPVLAVEAGVLLNWPLTETALRVESSSDLANWVPVSQPAMRVDGLYQMSLPRSALQKFFRLTAP